jgi:4-diphosphocytidyl-2-C-methyl-D-erythritol kinase
MSGRAEDAFGAAGSPVRVAEAAPAKLNLGLRVLGRRADGFHDLDSLFVRLDLADTVVVRAAADAGGTPVTHGRRRPSEAAPSADRLDRAPAGDTWLDDRPLTLGAANLVLRAVAAYRRAAAAVGVRVPPAELELVKRIPWGAGLAGGSADAAATLRALAAAWPAAVDLSAIGESLGSDVPFCLSGAAAARVGGRGERVVVTEVPPLDLLLVYPGAEVSAGAAFGWWASDRVEVPAPDVAALRAGRRIPLHNALEPAVAARVPEVRDALAGLRALRLGPVGMSGSGSTCFAWAADGAAARLAAHDLGRRRPDWWVRAVRSVGTGGSAGDAGGA